MLSREIPPLILAFTLVASTTTSTTSATIIIITVSANRFSLRFVVVIVASHLIFKTIANSKLNG
eukprot:m.46910 g.46910  ORF g.46910 m.46910 type:complete len:64 (-) comp10736_c0_seq1:84-275(-)